jgi:hypothetical protein
MDSELIAGLRNHSLASFVLEAGCEDGIAIESVDPGATLIVQTTHSEYRLVVSNSARRAVLVRGGNLFTDATPAVLQGATAGGNLVKTGWIGVGLHMELWVGRRRIITSRVRSVTVEP